MKRAFFLATQVLLILTAVGKLAGAVEWTAGHAAKEPVVHFISAREMLIVAAMLELLAVVGIWLSRTDLTKALWPFWLSMLFTGYRLELWYIGFTGYCSCFGSWSTWMHLSKEQVNLMAIFMIAFMLLGSTAIIASELIHQRKSVAGSDLEAKPTS